MAKKKPLVEKPAIVETIIDSPMEEIMGDRFAIYAKDVIQNRAIPDARDGLKPVQRRIIYAMYDEGNVFSKPTKKCAHTVGAVMGKYHPHGDSSIYEALARMSQTWVMRYPLIDFQGNNGSIDGDGPAAYRYTEARLAELSEELVRDIDKKTVEMQLTFDDTSFEPVVLPARFPNLLVNGSEGIAVAVATEIPPHNLKEVADAIIYRINHVRATNEDLRQFVLGPDFPTGGSIYRSEGLDSIYQTGRGKIEIVAKTEIVANKEMQQILVHEIPYGVNKSNILREIDLIRHNKQIDGILEVRDESDRQGLRIAIDLKKNVNADIILEYLLNKTQLRTNYSANMVAIEDNRPKTINLLSYVDTYIEHQVDVITKRSLFDLEKYTARLHIVEGLMKAISVLDEVIKLIRGSKDKADAKNHLIERFSFSNDQAEAIVMLQLYRLSNTDISVLENEKKKLEQDIEQLNLILNDRSQLHRVIINDLKALVAKYGDVRRTTIIDRGAVITIDKRDLIAKEDVMIAVTRDGYIKRSSLKSYRSSGDNALPGLKSTDLLVGVAMASTTDFLLAFTNLGNFLYIPVHEITDGKWKEEGKHINYLIAMNSDEKIVASLVITDFRKDISIVTVTKNGQIKRTFLNEFSAIRYSKPINCMRLLRGDEMVDAKVATGNSDILVLTENGAATFFNESELTPIGLKGSGVKAISSLKHNAVIGLLSYEPDEKGKIVALTSQGHIRVFDIGYIQKTSRLGKTQYFMKCFKSDPHELVYFDKIDRKETTLTLNVLTSKSTLLPIQMDDFRPIPVDKYAKKNIDQLSDDEVILGVYHYDIQIVNDKTKTYEPVVVYKEAVTVDTSVDQDNEAYEQISIFDDLGD